MDGLSNYKEFFYDFEFFDTGTLLLPISLGMVDEFDNELYFEFKDTFVWEEVAKDRWMLKNVLCYLTGDKTLTRQEAQVEIEEFIKPWETQEVRLWAWCGSYDHVVMNRIWGSMRQSPNWMPYFTRDVKEKYDRVTGSAPPKPKRAHHSLEDARWCKEAYLRALELGA